MKIKVNQTVSGRQSEYEVIVNDELKYTVGNSKTNVVMPIRVLGDAGGAGFSESNSMVEAAAAYSYTMVEKNADPAGSEGNTFGVKQKGSKGKVYDSKGEMCARFRKVKEEALKANFVIEYGDYSLNCYDKSAGRARNISIYKDDTQIAAVIKPLSTINNLDEYYIFLLDEYSALESIISLFVIFYDHRYYSNRGEKAASKKKVQVEYTFDKNDKYYNKNWIADNFGKETAETIEEEMRKKRSATSKGIKKQAKYIILFVILAWLVMFIVLGIINYYNGGIF